MLHTKLGLVSLLLVSALCFTGCNEVPDMDSISASGSDFLYRGHDFGPNRDADYIQGVKDGCKTSDGDYTKNHTLFDTENDYRTGWEHGRLHCSGKNTQGEK